MSTPDPRIVLVVPVFPRLSETFIVARFLGLLDRGWDVHVVCDTVDAQALRSHPALEGRVRVARRVHQCVLGAPLWRRPWRAFLSIARASARHPLYMLESLRTLARSLTRAGLADRHRLQVAQVVLGDGVPLFSDVETPLPLTHMVTRLFGGGVVMLDYEA